MAGDDARAFRYRLDDITDPEAVRRAVAEYDEMGRGAFLEKYEGFRPPTTYSLLLGGKVYDPKAILSAAYAYQYPDRGPLPNVFSGGKATTNRALGRRYH